MRLRIAALAWLPSLAGCSLALPFDELANVKTTDSGACTWTLSVETRYDASGRPFALDVGDFDSDGVPDVVLAANDSLGDVDFSSIQVHLNRGEQSFEDWYTSAKNSAPGGSMITRGVATGDVDNNGTPDVVQSYASYDYVDGSFDLSRGLGDGRLEWDGIWTVPEPDNVALGDFDGDGWLDAAVVARTDDAGVADEKVLLAWGTGSGTFDQPVAYENSSVFTNTIREIAVSDVNADGKADLVMTSWGWRQVEVLLGTADRGMHQMSSVAVGSAPWGVTAADFDRDGKIDLAVTNNGDFSVSIVHGTGDGGFERETPITGIGKSLRSILAVDLDQDEDMDLAIGDEAQIFTLLNNGDGTFAEKRAHMMDGTPNRFASADFDQNGLPDLAFSNLGRNSFSVFWSECEEP